MTDNHDPMVSMSITEPGNSSNYAQIEGAHKLQATPEPSAMTMMLIGIGLLAAPAGANPWYHIDAPRTFAIPA